MGQSLSANKRERQNEVRRMRNKINKSVLKTTLRRCKKELTETGDSEKGVAAAQKALDIAARKGAIPKKRASRKASRFAKAANKAKAAAK